MKTIAACLLPLNKLGLDNSIQIFPTGLFNAPQGSLLGEGYWLLNAQIAKQLINKAKNEENILIDYDHQSILFAKNFKALEAAGTFSGKNLKWVEGVGLFASNINWTDTAQEYFKKDKYRYISPLFTYDPKSREVTRIISITLTDNPAIKNMRAVNRVAATAYRLSEQQTGHKVNNVDTIIAAATAYQLSEQQAGHKVNNVDAISHITKGKGKAINATEEASKSIIAAATAYQLSEQQAGRKVNNVDAISHVTKG